MTNESECRSTTVFHIRRIGSWRARALVAAPERRLARGGHIIGSTCGSTGVQVAAFCSEGEELHLFSARRSTEPYRFVRSETKTERFARAKVAGVDDGERPVRVHSTR